MVGRKSNAGTQINNIQPNALPIHCHIHSVSLMVNDVTFEGYDGQRCRDDNPCQIFPKTRKKCLEISSMWMKVPIYRK